MKTKRFIQLEFSEKSTADLRGKQSVRTTFRLTERAIAALSLLAGQMGIKQKSLFDHLIEDTRALRTIAEQFGEVSGQDPRVAKTYVISRRTLETLELVSNQYDTPRDVLVEYSIARILPLLQQEKKKHRARQQILGELDSLLSRGAALLEAAEGELGEDDPAFIAILQMMRSMDNCTRTVADCVNRGSRIEEF